MAQTELASLVLRMSADSAQLRTDLQQVRRSTKSMEQGFSNAARNIQRAVSAIAVGKLVQEVMQAADMYRLLSARIGLVVKDERMLQAVEQKLFETAQQTRQSYKGTAELYARLARNTQNLAVSQDDLLKITRLVGQSILISGTNAHEAYGGLIQFSQGLASGELRGEELRSVMENIPGLAEAIVKGLDAIGVTVNGTVGDLRRLSRAGELTSDVMIRALLTQVDRLDSEFRGIPVTVSQAMIQLANDVQRGVAQADMSPLIESIQDLRTVVSDPATIEAFTRLFAVITEGVAMIARGWTEIFNLITAGIEFIDRRTMRASQSVAQQFQSDIAKARKELDDLVSQEIRGEPDGAADRQKRISELRSQILELEQLRRRAAANEATVAIPNVDLSVKNPSIPRIDESDTKELDKAIEKLRSLREQLELQVETFGKADAAVLQYRLEQGDLAEVVEKSGADGRALASEIVELARRYDELSEEAERAKESLKIDEELRGEIEAIVDALRTEEQAIRASYDARRKIVEQSVERRIITEARAAELIAGLAAKEAEEIKEALEKNMTEMEQFARDVREQIKDHLGDQLFNAMQGKFDSIGDAFKAMLDRMVADALAVQLANAVFGSFNNGSLGGIVGAVVGAFGGGGGNAAAAGVGAAGLDAAIGDFITAGLAHGGPAFPGKLYLVGERGPELFAPGTAGRVIPNDAMPGGITVNLNVSGVRDDGHLKQSAGQIAAQAGVAVQRAMRRNT